MLAADVVFEGFSATDWTRLLAAFEPAPRPDVEARPRGGVIALHDGERLRKLLHTRAGRLELDAQPWPEPLADLAERHHAAWAAAIRQGGLEEAAERWGARVRRDDDLVAQALHVLALVRELEQDGAIELWPRRASAIPLPSANLLGRPLDVLCPAGRSMVLGLFERGELWTSVAIARDARGISRILGPDELRRDMGVVSGDFRRDYRYLAAAVERRLGRIALGCFTEAATLRALISDPAPGAWARAVSVRDVVLAPMRPAVAVPLGLDAARAAVGLARAVVERLDPLGLAQRHDGAEAAPDARAELLELLRRWLAR